MSGFRLLAVDIDGTLVNSCDELTPATQAAILQANRSGIRVVLATGRRYSRTLPLVEPLGIGVPLVTASGALVKDPADHCTFFRAEFQRQTLIDTLALVDQAGFDPVVCGDTFLQGFDYYHATANVRSRELAEYIELNPDCGRVLPTLLANPPGDAFMVFTMGTQAEMLDIENRLHRRLSGRLVTHVLRSPRYRGFLCEIAPAGVDKWSGVRHLAGHWGIADETICAVGDDVNDIPMIRGAGLGVAMGNALPTVKAAADWVVSTHDEDGLVQVVQRILRKPPEPRTRNAV